MKTCRKCKKSYTEDLCPRCHRTHSDEPSPSDLAWDSSLFGVVEAVASVCSSSVDSGSFDGGGGSFDGGGVSGDW